MRYLVGIDDTDNLESRGTGFRARQLGERLANEKIAIVDSITRHQLLVDPRIPYTSHNSSCCLVVNINIDSDPKMENPTVIDADLKATNTDFEALRRLSGVDMLVEFCRQYLLDESADGSDAGLCVVPWDGVTIDVRNFSEAAKRQVLHRADALELAERNSIFLEGLTGDGGGVIGSLAAAGLRRIGNDGRVLWLQGLRELEGIYSAERLYAMIPINDINSLSGTRLGGDADIDIGTWARPIMRNGRTVFLVEEVENDTNKWRIAPKDIIKQCSD